MRSPTVNPREARLRELLDTVILRRCAGEVVADDSLIESHSDLMPELGEALGDLRRVEAARQRAAAIQRGPGSSSPADGTPLSTGHPAADAIPGYELHREIHRGAQGVVYEAL